MDGLFSHLMDMPSQSDRYVADANRAADRHAMQMRLWLAEARRLFPGRPEMQKLYVQKKLAGLDSKAMEIQSKYQEIGENIRRPKPLRM